MNLSRLLTCLLGLALGATSTAAEYSRLWGERGERWSPAGRLPDFSFAGYHRGESPIPDVPVTTDVTRFGANGHDDADDTQAFREAIQATTRGAILVPPGRYVISDVIEIRKSGVVLRGAGPDRSTLEFPKSLEDVRPNPGATTTGRPTSNYSWSGGFLWVMGRTSGRALAKVTAEARRGDDSLQVDHPEALRAGMTIRIELTDDEAGSLINVLYAGDPGPTDQLRPSRRTTDFVARVSRVVGDIVTIDRPLRTETRLAWHPTVLSFAPEVSEVGIEGLGFRFPNKPYEGHFTERGANAIALGDVVDCWVRDVSIHNGDSGLFVNGRFCTVQGVRISSERTRDAARQSTGHHGIQVVGDDNVTLDFDFQTRFVHDLTVAGCHGNVFCDGRGEDLSLDHHKYAPYANLFTNLDAGAGTQLWICGGGADLGRHCAAWGTFWNIRADRPLSWPPRGFAPDLINLVGLATHSPSVLNSGGRWFEAIPPEELAPRNLWEAQRARRLGQAGPGPGAFDPKKSQRRLPPGTDPRR